MLMRKGVDPSVPDKALRCSCLNGAVAMGAAALMMIDEAPGCDLGAREAFKQTPLMLAAVSGLLGVVKALVGKGMEVDAVDKLGETALAHAMFAKEEGCTVYLLEEAGASWRATIRDAPRDESISMVGLAISTGIPHVVKAVMQRMRADGLDGEGLLEYVERATREIPMVRCHWRH